MTSALLSRRIAILAFIGGLGGGLVFPIIPALGLQLGISGFMIGLILSANRILRLVFNVPAGYVINQFGPRLTLASALGIETLAVLCYSAALYFGHAQWWLLIGRAFFGIGTAFLFVGAQATVLSLSEKADRGRMVSTVRVAMSAAVPAGLVIGGVLADVFSDNVAFLTGAAITFIGALFAALFLPPFISTTSSGDISGTGYRHFSALLKAPARPFLFAAWGYNLLVFLTLQGVLLATMVLMIQKRNFHLFGMQAQGTSGLVMAVLIGASALVAIYIGRAIDRIRLRASLVIPALGLFALGFVVLALSRNSLWLLLLASVMIGLSYNGVTLPLMALLGDATTREQHGPAVGVYQFFGDIGGTIGPVAGIEAGMHFGYESLYLAIAVLIVFTIPVAVWVRRFEMRQDAKQEA